MREGKSGQTTWNLEDAFPAGGPKDFGRLERQLVSEAQRFEKIRESISKFTRTDMEEALAVYEHCYDKLVRLLCFAYMKFAEDTRNQDVKAMLDRTEELRADVDNRVLFFRLWWIGLSAEKAGRISPANPDYAYFLATLRKLKPHTLEEKVEQVINLKNTTGFSGWVHHYDQITTTYTFQLKVRGKTLKGSDGKPREFVRDEVSEMYASPDPAMREAAYRAVLARYASEGNVLGEVYRTIVRDWRNEYVKLRAYPTPISARNLENDVPDRSVETLLTVCRKNAAVFQDFFSLKAKMLGVKKLSRFDIYAPLLKKQKKASYEESVKLVMDAFSEFDERFAGLALRVFTQGHVDSSPRRGKETGAFCMSVTPDVVPFLLLNYSGKIRDAYTIAHESGHAVHSQLASAHSVLTFQPPLVLAETASVFGEMILYDKMMRDEKDAEVKRSVLLEKLSSIYATIGRQAYFVIFEADAHKAVTEGATVSRLCSTYIGNLKEQFEPAVSVPEEFKWEWSSIPHIYHTPFYCYAYAFGNLLSLALYERYAKEGKRFIPTYLKLLSYGGSASPADVLEEVGVEISSERFWQGGF
ncbi:MAG TPA: M3 family oligoendopeptidase, partial [Nitrososphaerales archaeon]|nr:M3 family oligoendopeptidase [Nitrososphaerales archaeon]